MGFCAPLVSSRRIVDVLLKKLGLVVVVSIATLLVCELGFRIAGFQPLYSVYSKPEIFWRHDPLLGWSLEPNSEGTYVGPRPFPILFRSSIRTNSLGLRGPEVADVPEGGIRVLVLGDSMTAGFEVEESATYSAHAEERLRTLADVPVQVVNGGVRGYGTDQVYLLFRDRLRELDPDIVVYHTTANDPDDVVTLHRARRPFGKAAFALRDDGALDTVGHPIPRYDLCSSVRLDKSYSVTRVDTFKSRALCNLQTRLADHSALFSFISTRLAQNPGALQRIYRLGGDAPPAEMPAHARRLTRALIRHLQADAERGGARFVLLAQQVDLDAIELTDIGPDGTIVYLDAALGARPGDEVRFPVDGHYNEEGHRLVGELLARELAQAIDR
ncbi:MAG: SGNH/GDSL hydrolase family protein [Actinomycetota bacterium]|nr:SGNH/GDSL hydrolase family protein [Actinomycetota bacterium]